MEEYIGLVPKVFAAFAVFLVFRTLFVITPGKRAKVVEFLGKPQKKAFLPGFSVKAPWPLARIVGTVNLQQQEVGADVSVKTADNAFMTLPVKVQYRASSAAEGAVRAFYELENPEQQIMSYVLNSAKTTAAGMEMAELYKNRDSIESEVLNTLKQQFDKYGFEILNVLVDEPQPSEEVRKAFNEVIASERRKEAAQNLAEAERIKLVGIAKAEKESKKLQGEGVAAMREAIARGMDQAMKTLQEAGLTAGEALALLMDTNRLDTLGSAAAHGNLILADMHGGGTELTNVMAAMHAASRASTNGKSSNAVAVGAK